MAILTKPQIEKQKRKYESFIKNSEILSRIGEEIVKMSAPDRYNKIALVLENQGIKHAMCHPDNLKRSYNDLLTYQCLNAYSNTLES